MVSSIQECIAHLKQHFLTSLLTYVTNGIQDFVKCCMKSWLHIDLQLNNILFEGFKGRTGDVTYAKLWTSPVLPKYGQDISGFSMG